MRKEEGGMSINPAINNILLKPEGKKIMDRTAFKNGYIQ
jgi:hypothetical protein